MKTFPPPGRRHARLPALLLLLVCTWACHPPSCLARLGVERLRVESLDSPLGLDTPTPRLSWILTSRERAQYQSAFQILVASRDDLLVPGQADLWDSVAEKALFFHARRVSPGWKMQKIASIGNHVFYR